MILKLLSFIFFLLPMFAQARRNFEYQRPIWSMGMGGVYTPFPREGDMPTTNAAYLRHVKTINLEVLNLAAGAPGLTAIQDFQDLPPMDDFSDLNSYMGKTIWTGLDGRVSFVSPNFGLSLYNNIYLKSYFTNPLMPEWYLEYFNDYGMTIAGALPMGPDLSFGFAVKRINRWGGANVVDFDTIDQYISTQDSDVILDLFSDKGIAYGMDLSLLYKKADSPSSPIFTVVWKDLGSTTFQKTAGNRAPPHIADNLILGAGYEFDGPVLGAKAGFEYRNIQTKNMQIGQKLHMGTELSIGFIDLRAGLSQGYATYGLGLDLWLFRLDVAQFTVEEGFYPGQSPEQRIQMGLTLDLSVDANFSVTSSNGKRRKLKQRR